MEEKVITGKCCSCGGELTAEEDRTCSRCGTHYCPACHDRLSQTEVGWEGRALCGGCVTKERDLHKDDPLFSRAERLAQEKRDLALQIKDELNILLFVVREVEEQPRETAAGSYALGLARLNAATAEGAMTVTESDDIPGLIDGLRLAMQAMRRLGQWEALHGKVLQR